MANGAYVGCGDGFGDDLYLTTRCQLLQPGDICIVTCEPVYCVEFEGYVFDATYGADFQFRAYDKDGNLVLHQTWDAGEGAVNYSTGPLSTGIYTLRFSDHGIHDIGVDDLKLCTMSIPAPGGLLLTSIGILGVG